MLNLDPLDPVEVYNSIKGPGEVRLSDRSIRSFLYRNGYSLLTRELDAILRRLDHDDDQSLSYTELTEALGLRGSSLYYSSAEAEYRRRAADRDRLYSSLHNPTRSYYDAYTPL